MTFCSVISHVCDGFTVFFEDKNSKEHPVKISQKHPIQKGRNHILQDR
jgi:hypothetical protein